MARKHHKTEQIIPILRSAEVEIGDKLSVTDFCRNKGITEQTYYRWRKSYG